MSRHAYLVAAALSARIDALETERRHAQGPWLDRVLEDLAETRTLLAGLGRGSSPGPHLVQTPQTPQTSAPQDDRSQSPQPAAPALRIV